MNSSTVVFLLSLLLLAAFLGRRRKYPSLPLPPGPKGWPLLGNLKEFRHVSDGPHTWERYAEWSKTYGPLVHLTFLGQHVIVVNSAKVASELLDKRSYNSSNRPGRTMTSELLQWYWNPTNMPYSDWWRLHRRLLHQVMNVQAVSQYYPVHRQSAKLLLQRLANTPDDFVVHLRQYLTSTILHISYAFDLEASSAYYASLAEKAVQGISKYENFGNSLVDIIPALKYVPSWMPGASFHAEAREFGPAALALRDQPYAEVKRQIAAGTLPCSCFVSENLARVLEQQSEVPSDIEEAIKNCAGILFAGGADTTISSLVSFILAMSIYPDVQAKAQVEIDSITEGTRLPDFSDRPSLPYVDAVVKEALRWIPVAPLGNDHASVNDDEYEGMLIPGGTTIIANVWAILHDPEVYQDPSSFKPERFLETPVPPDPANAAFGFGRRICPGRHLAANTLWLTVAVLLATFKISKALDESGKEIEPSTDRTEGLISYPVPFKCRIMPRSKEALSVALTGYSLSS